MSEITVTEDQLSFNGVTYRAAIGAGGFVDEDQKVEGDKKTPRGSYSLRGCFYRPDRLSQPKTGLILNEINPAMGWCDDTNHDAYNKLVVLPFDGSHEELFREDATYDVLVVIGYNDAPPEPGKGSAIFLHVAKEGYLPTEGCVALAKEDLLQLLAQVTPETTITLG